jgi:hypothetical protein
MHCWTLPPHQEAWKRFAALQGGRGPYLRFANMLINDATYLLDDALKKVQVRPPAEQVACALGAALPWHWCCLCT